MSSSRVDVVVVGAGHNGLTAAALLARAGLDVVVFEQHDRAGGAMATEELFDGYRFSTCAYALHLLHERVVEALRLDLDLLPSPEATVVLPDGVVLRPDEAGARELGELDGWRAWDAEWRDAARVVDRTLLSEPPTWSDLARETGLASVTMAELLAEHFVSAQARALFTRPYFEADDNDPGEPLAYAWLETSRCRDQRCQGVPRRGMGRVADAFVSAAKRAGARMEVAAPVASTRTGVVELHGGERVEARAILVNAAPDRPRRLGPPAAKVHCALRGDPDLSLLRSEREQLGVIHVLDSTGARVELQLPTLRDDSLAPPGCHSLSLFLPDATAVADPLAAAERAIPNLRKILVDHVVHDRRAIGRLTGLPQGQIHQVPHVASSMFDRRGGARTEIEGVYRCGAAAHPGGEVSGIPGWNAAAVVLADLS